MREVVFEIVDINQENVISGDVGEQLGLLKPLLSETILDTTPISQVTEPLDIHDFPELIKPQVHSRGNILSRLTPMLKVLYVRYGEMEENGYIVSVDEQSEWVSSMVVAFKNQKVRICKDLNLFIKHEHHTMKTFDEVISAIPGAKVFSKLHAKSGFLQIKLDQPSSFWTTFNTPIGRYRWLRLPFSIKSAPEIYRHVMDWMIEGISGAFAIVDDILVAGHDQEEHDHILKAVVQCATEF